MFHCIRFLWICIKIVLCWCLLKARVLCNSCVWWRDRVRERRTESERERETDRVRERETDREWERETDRQRVRDRQSERKREGGWFLQVLFFFRCTITSTSNLVEELNPACLQVARLDPGRCAKINHHVARLFWAFLKIGENDQPFWRPSKSG